MAKAPYRSRITVAGLDRAPHRAFLRASGLDEEDLDKPRLGIADTRGDNTPCSMSLAPQVDAARLGVAAGGGVPIGFSTIPVSGCVPKNHQGDRLNLISREIHADPVGAVNRAQSNDGLNRFAGLDKTPPAMMMAMVRLNCPSVFVYGGAMLPGHWR